MANVIAPSRTDAFMEALDECREFGKLLRENRLFVGKALRAGRSKVARDVSAPASPWPASYELRSRERGVHWSEEHSSRGCVFCDNPNTPGSVKPFPTPEEMVAHLRVFHRQFEYFLDMGPDFCRIIFKLSKKPIVPLHAHPERRTGAELNYANENKHPGYVPTSSPGPARLRRIAAPSNYGQDEYNPFTLIPAKVLVNQVEVPADMDVSTSEPALNQIDGATPSSSKNPRAPTPGRSLPRRTRRSATNDRPRGTTANNRHRASALVTDDISTTPSLPNSPIDVDALPDGPSEIKPTMTGMQARKEQKSSQQAHVGNKRTRAGRRTKAPVEEEPSRVVNSAVLEHPPPHVGTGRQSAEPTDVARGATRTKTETGVRRRRRANRSSKSKALRAQSPNPETSVDKAMSSKANGRPQRSKRPPKKLGMVPPEGTDDDSDGNPRPRKRARVKVEYVAPKTGPPIIQPGPKPLNAQGLPQITKEFVNKNLFHSILNHEIIVDDFNNGFDSDGAEENDLEWRLEFKNSLLHDFVDMYSVEKLFMMLWNQFSIKEYKMISDKCVYPALHAFLDKYGPELRRIRFEVLFVRHVTILYRCGLVDADGVHVLLQKLKKIEPSRRVHPGFLWGIKMLCNEKYVPKAYGTAEWCKTIEGPARDIDEDHFNSKSLFPPNPYSSQVVGIPGRSSPSIQSPVVHTLSGQSSSPRATDGPSPIDPSTASHSKILTGGPSSRPSPIAEAMAPRVGGTAIRPLVPGGSSSSGTDTEHSSRPNPLGSGDSSSRPGAFVASPSARPVGGIVIGRPPAHIAGVRASTPDTPSSPPAASALSAVRGPPIATNVLDGGHAMLPAGGPPTPRAQTGDANRDGGPHSVDAASATVQDDGAGSPAQRSDTDVPMADYNNIVHQNGPQ